MKATQKEKLNQIVSRTDLTGNEKVELLVEFTGEYAATHQEGEEEFTGSEDVPPHNLFTEDEDSPTTLPQISEKEIIELMFNIENDMVKADEDVSVIEVTTAQAKAIHQLMKGK